MLNRNNGYRRKRGEGKKKQTETGKLIGAIGRVLCTNMKTSSDVGMVHVAKERTTNSRVSWFSLKIGFALLRNIRAKRNRKTKWNGFEYDPNALSSIGRSNTNTVGLSESCCATAGKANLSLEKRTDR